MTKHTDNIQIKHNNYLKKVNHQVYQKIIIKILPFQSNKIQIH